MTGDVQRACGFVLVGSLALLGPALEGRVGTTLAAVSIVGPFGVLAALALASTNGPLFEFFARDADREEGRLYGLAGFALAAAALGVLAVTTSMPAAVFVSAVFVLTTGNLAQMALLGHTTDAFVAAAAFVAAGTLGGVVGFVGAAVFGASLPSIPLVVFVVTSGALLGGLFRSALFVHDDPLVLVSVGLLVWFLLGLDIAPMPTQITVGLAFTAALGYVAYALGTASVTGMLTGVLLALFAVVLGGYGWFVLLVTFFGLGGLSSKYRYEEKLERGVAQDDEGARGSGNVLANSAVALVAVVAFAVSGDVGLPPELFQVAFAGAVAAALADTFSSEFGGLFDDPRLITTLERVPAGTDGGVTWQGALFGLVGSGIVAGLAGLFFSFGTSTTTLVLAAGFFGMLFDSLLGATLEGELLDNQGVNLLATLAAALVALVAFWVGPS